MLAVAYGNLPGWLTLAGVVAVAYGIWRGAGGTALSTLQTANRILEKRVHSLEAQGREDAKTIAELKGKTDMALAVRPFMTWAQEHEDRAQERHEKTLIVLDLIASRLGSDA